MVDDHSKVKQSGEKKHLTYKQINLEGFSIFCDFQNIDEVENGGVDVDKLIDEQK
jgi:hypothetical protein